MLIDCFQWNNKYHRVKNFIPKDCSNIYLHMFLAQSKFYCYSLKSDFFHCSMNSQNIIMFFKKKETNCIKINSMSCIQISSSN